MKKLASILIVLLLGLTFAQVNFPLTIVEANGVELTFDAPPERVVCLDFLCMQNMAFLDIPPLALGEALMIPAADPAFFGEAAEDIESVPSRPDIDWEAVAALEPDLILGWRGWRETAEVIAPFYAHFYGDDTLESYTIDLRLTAALLGVDEAEIESRIQPVFDRADAYAESIPQDLFIMITFPRDDRGSEWRSNPNYSTCGVLEAFGSCPSEFENGNVSIEGMLELNPDVLVIENYDNVELNQILEALDDDPLWPELNAHNSERILALPVQIARPDNMISLQLWLDTVLPAIYPDIFPDGPLTDEQVQEILAENQ